MKFLLPVLVVVLAIASPSNAHALSMSPMAQRTSSFADYFIFRVSPKNTGSKPANVIIRAYDKDFKLIKAAINPRKIRLSAGRSRTVSVKVPFEGKSTRRIRICSESIPNRIGQTRIRIRICGKFLAKRIQLVD